MLTGIVLGSSVLIDGVAGWVVGIAGAFVAGAVWTLFIAPKAGRRLDEAPRIAAEFVLFAAAAALLVAGGLGLWGVALFVLWVVDTAVIVMFGITEEDFFVNPTE